MTSVGYFPTGIERLRRLGIVAVLCLTLVVTVVEGAFDWTFITASVVAILLVPRSRIVTRALCPVELAVIVAIPLLWHPFSGHGLVIDTVTYLAVAALALVIAVELHQFTAVRMTHTFAIGFVVLTTLSVAGVWNVLQWFADVALGTSFLLDGRSQAAINNDVMLEFVNAGVAGFGGGIVFDVYFRSRDRSPTERTYVPPKPLPDDHAETGRRNSETGGLSPRRQRQTSRAMQFVLALVLCWGLYARDLPTIANAALALAITFVRPSSSESTTSRWTRGLVLWITTAVFLHALGTTGFYVTVGTWDTITHALSASIVAAAGYAFFRAVNVHGPCAYPADDDGRVHSGLRPRSRRYLGTLRVSRRLERSATRTRRRPRPARYR